MSEPYVWVVLPTYNEAPNLEALVAALLPVLPQRRAVLVVDDASPDGTGEIADTLAGRHPEVHVLHRLHKEGLGPAYLAGFREALARGADLVMEMDADFSHDPAHIPDLLAAARDADVVLGSRYCEGGGVAGWGALRRAISRGGSLYARAMLGLAIRDLTGGFKVFRREVLERIDLDSVGSRGYAFQVELTYRAAREGFRIAEVPIVFHERRAGQSKMTGAIVAEAAMRVPLLRMRAGPARIPQKG